MFHELPKSMHGWSAPPMDFTLGIDEVIAEVLPDQKIQAIKQLQQAGRIVAKAGDGINDASALAQANIGIVVGSGTDVATESVDVTLVKGDLRGIVRTRPLESLDPGKHLAESFSRLRLYRRQRAGCGYVLQPPETRISDLVERIMIARCIPQVIQPWMRENGTVVAAVG